MSYAADDTQAIAARLKELQAEKDQALTGSSVPAKEEKAEDLPMGYGDYLTWSPSAFNDAVREQMTSKHQHDVWPANVGRHYAPVTGQEKNTEDIYAAAMWGIGGTATGSLSHPFDDEQLKSLAHPQWPYAGTGFEWRKFVKVS
jgi:hypothetical protein